MNNNSEYEGFREARNRHEEGTLWFPLDNAAKIFPAIQGVRYSTLFRLSAVLDHPVKLPQLECALQRVMQRYPYFQVVLGRGVFWYYLERVAAPPAIMPDGRCPCTRYRLKARGTYLLRVRVYRRRIAVEFCHVLTDGSGGAMFLQSLITEYFRQCGVSISDWGEIPNPDDTPVRGEFRDANQIVGIEEFPPAVWRSPAYHATGQLLPRNEYAVVTGLISVQQLRQYSKNLGVSLTEYLAAVLFWVYQESIAEQPEKLRRRSQKRPIRILLPVNLRPFYPTKTRRNFFVFVDPEIDLRLGRYDFEELAQRVHSYMKIEVNKKNLNRHLSRNVASERSWYVRMMPLFVKDIILKIVYRFWSDRLNTTSLSNIGRLRFPAEIEQHIEWVEFVPPPSPIYGVSVAAVSHGDVLSVTFGSLLEETEIERRFFRFLRGQGMNVRIISNRGDTRHKSKEESVCHTV